MFYFSGGSSFAGGCGYKDTSNTDACRDGCGGKRMIAAFGLFQGISKSVCVSICRNVSVSGTAVSRKRAVYVIIRLFPLILLLSAAFVFWIPG